MADFTLSAKVVSIGVVGAVDTTVTLELKDSVSGDTKTFSLELPNTIVRNLHPGSVFTMTQGDVAAVIIDTATPIDAHTYVGHILGHVAAAYQGSNVAALVAKAYSRVIATGVDTAFAGGNANVAADGTFNSNCATNPQTAATEFVYKLFDGATQIGLETVIPAS